MRIVFDYDFLIYEAASVAEERSIIATHKPTGIKREFDNRTKLYGHHKKKSGGWIAQENEMAGNDYYKAEDFEIEEVRKLRPFKIKSIEGDSFITPLDGAKKILDDKVRAICAKLRTNDYYGYVGKGDVFRHTLATLLPYKGGRTDMQRPLLLDEMKRHVIDQHGGILVYNEDPALNDEADDRFSMDVYSGYKAWKQAGEDEIEQIVGVAIDKDRKGTEGWTYNPNKDKEPQLVTGFGSLWLDDKGEVEGNGRIWLYWQIAHGDDTDGYVANCFSDIKYAGKGAYNDLVDCKTDKEAFTKLVEIFKRMYPEKKTVTTFRGEIEIDWLYVMQEMATMAFMKRWPGDKIDIKNVLDKLGVNYE
jgi:hypothetical protein